MEVFTNIKDCSLLYYRKIFLRYNDNNAIDDIIPVTVIIPDRLIILIFD